MDNKITLVYQGSHLHADEIVSGIEDLEQNLPKDDAYSKNKRSLSKAFTQDSLRTLYVKRRLLNAGAVRVWAKSQGLESALPADDMHVTVAFSKAPVNWSSLVLDKDSIVVLDESIIKFVEGAASWKVHDSASTKKRNVLKRAVHQFPAGNNPNGALVLLIESDLLHRRWEYYLKAGASWNHDAYRPHVTITYSVPEAATSAMEPYRGPLIFGPEEMEEVRDGMGVGVPEEPLAKEFDPDQPRDNDGKWTTYYHGTSEEAWQDIKVNGLVPGKGRGADAAFTIGNADDPDFLANSKIIRANAKIASRAASVYLVDDVTSARVYAHHAKNFTKTQPVLLKVRVPAGDRNLVRDEASHGRRYKGKIPPEYIELVGIGSGMYKGDDAQTFYAVVVFLDAEKAFNPDQPREPAGSPEGGQWTGGSDGGESSSDAGSSSGASSRTYSDPKTWKTTADVDKAFRDDFHLYITRDKDSGLSEKNFIERAGVVHEVTRDLLERFPSLREEGKYLSSASPLAAFNIELTKGRDMEGKNSRALGSYNKRSGELRLAASLQKGEGVLKAGEWTIGGSKAGSTLRHEFGHSTEAFFSRKLGEVGLVAPGQHPVAAMQSWYNDSKSTIGKTLSKYGATSREEWFAESFSAYTHPDYKSSKVKIHPKLEQAFAKIYGEPR